MAINRRFVPYTSAAVFSVLRDGESYARWVVGTAEIRSIEGVWPAPGSALHYRLTRAAGAKEDETRSVQYRPGVMLELEAAGRPFGTVQIEFFVDEVHGGSLITLRERPNRGVAKLVHNKVFDLAIWIRNLETLRRLAVEIRDHGDIPALVSAGV
jgi:hypothetical protein